MVWNQKKIASEIGCSGRTVRRELKEGEVELLNSDLTIRKEYSADKGQQKHDYKATAKGPMLKIRAKQYTTILMPVCFQISQISICL